MGTVILPILKTKVQKVELLAQGHRAGYGGIESDLGPNLTVKPVLHTLLLPFAYLHELNITSALVSRYSLLKAAQTTLAPVLLANSAAAKAAIGSKRNLLSNIIHLN